MLIGFITHHFRLYRRSAFEAVGGWDASYPAAIDYDLCLRLGERFPVRHVKRVLYDYRIRPGSISTGSRPLQRRFALKAVNASLARRGEADRFHVVLGDDGKFHLQARRLL